MIHDGFGKSAVLLVSLSLIGVTHSSASAAQNDAEKGAVEAATTDTTAVVTDEGDGVEDAPSPLSASVTAGTGIGLGTFVGTISGENTDQRRELVTAYLSAAARYKLGDTTSLSSSVGFTWFPVVNAAVGYAQGRTLLGDLGISLSDGKIASHEDLGLNLSGSLSMSLPTSKSSQLQNRYFSLKPALSLSWALGSLSISYSASATKYFMSSTVPSIDCDGYDDPTLCPEGRGTGPGGAYQTQRDGAELFLPSAGINSFTLAHSVNVRYSNLLLDGLSVGLGVGTGHSFTVVSEEVDEMSSVNAKSGRGQVDSLATSITAGYVINSSLSAGASLSTSTGRPFGADGKDLVLLDFARAADNITTVGFSLTGSL